MENEKIFVETITIMADFATKTDKLNKRLITAFAIIIIAISISFATAVCYGYHAYFYSDYQYPDVSQEVKQDNGNNANQEVKQSIKKESDD